jgi:hypothetical protein
MVSASTRPVGRLLAWKAAVLVKAGRTKTLNSECPTADETHERAMGSVWCLHEQCTKHRRISMRKLECLIAERGCLIGKRLT